MFLRDGTKPGLHTGDENREVADDTGEKEHTEQNGVNCVRITPKNLADSTGHRVKILIIIIHKP